MLFHLLVSFLLYGSDCFACGCFLACGVFFLILRGFGFIALNILLCFIEIGSFPGSFSVKRMVYISFKINNTRAKMCMERVWRRYGVWNGLLTDHVCLLAATESATLVKSWVPETGQSLEFQMAANTSARVSWTL